MSAPAEPRDRGLEFGRAQERGIRANVKAYDCLFATLGALERTEVARLGESALDAIRAYSADLADEIEGIAAGAGLQPARLGALNARTEILGVCRARAHECTVAVCLGVDGVPPVAVQTWDWHDLFRDSWLVWTIEHPSGAVVRTLTEFGIVGKIGVSSAGLAVLLNILRHADDGTGIGTPVHAIARRILDEARDVNDALLLIGAGAPSASSAITLVAAEGDEKTAVTAELRPGGPAYVLPSEDGLLVHTNHFLDAGGAQGDLEPALGPDSFFRLEMVRRRLAAAAPQTSHDVVAAMATHLGGAGAVCCHPRDEAQLGDRYATLAVVEIDVCRASLTVHAGGPCTAGREVLATGPAAAP